MEKALLENSPDERHWGQCRAGLLPLPVSHYDFASFLWEKIMMEIGSITEVVLEGRSFLKSPDKNPCFGKTPPEMVKGRLSRSNVFENMLKKGKNGTRYSTLADCHLAILRSGLSYLFSEKLPFLSDTMISTRRFACRPAEVLSVATG